MLRNAAVALACLVAGTGLLASRNGVVSPLAGADYAEIETQYGRSLHDLSLGTDAGRAFAGSFTPDGEWVLPTGRSSGRNAIAAQSLALKGRRFWLSNLHVEPLPSGITGWGYVVQSQGTAFVEAGLYQDVWVRTRDGWRVQTRTYHPGTTWPRKDLPEMMRGASTGQPRTATDYAEMENLIARYNVGYDNSGPFDKGLLSVQPFTPDTRFERINGPTFTGADAAKQSGGHAPLLHHWDSNLVIAAGPDGEVSSVGYDLTFNVEQGGSPVKLGTVGLLHHRFRMTPEGWRIGYRRYEGVGTTPQINWPDLTLTPISATFPPEKPARKGVMGATDFVAIKQLYLLANVALDSEADGGRRFADTFTPDGVLVQGTVRTAGRDAIARLAAVGAPGLHRWITNITPEPTRAGATGRAYGFRLGLKGEPGVPENRIEEMVVYEDRLVKTAQGWRFTERRVTSTPAVRPPA
ncbi:MAG: nuclear transport factor 2 family protein [Vicinamibacterales bacterium]